ncbi:MAG: FHA domain-containing protein [Cytophagaceae bacterium]|nr:FHA domain-containing protein [Cytophagaceae bacterium]
MTTTNPGTGGMAPRSDATVPGGQMPAGGGAPRRKTMIEGDDESPANAAAVPQNTLAGFLVSFSNTETGEFWALREGNNPIGSSSENDIVLSEQHVSGKHASINVRNDGPNLNWRFQLVDLSSSNGTYLNDERLDIFTGVTMQPNDKLRIGGYEFLLLSADKFVHGLTRNDQFKATQAAFDYSARDLYGDDRTRAGY